jgi:hypothetical protein
MMTHIRHLDRQKNTNPAGDMFSFGENAPQIIVVKKLNYFVLDIISLSTSRKFYL